MSGGMGGEFGDGRILGKNLATGHSSAMMEP